MSLTYTSYLKVDELVQLQEIQSKPEQHDELLFIIIHQTYELWFKQILHEVDLLKVQLNNGQVWAAIKNMKRILTIMKLLVQQTDILETMTPLSFASFRSFLDNASGFQSVQFREFELLLGLRYKKMFSLHEEDSIAYKTLKKRAEETTIWECFINLLISKGYDVQPAVRINEQGLLFEPSESLQEILFSISKNDEELNLLCELLVDLDEGLQEWRYRHVKMVERTIGNKIGTGGSDGVEYLKRTLFHPVFPDLWAIRSKF